MTSVQQGVIGQYEAAKLMMMGSNGRLEVAAPLSDDERRDQEVHIRGQFGLALALQVKTSTYLHMYPKRTTGILQVQFDVVLDRLVNHPLYWYLFAYLEQEIMGFRDPIFLIDSTAVHTHAGPIRRGDKLHLEFQGSMSPRARDFWARYQVHPKDLGKRVLQIIRDAGKTAGAEALPTAFGQIPDPGLLWVGSHRAAA